LQVIDGVGLFKSGLHRSYPCRYRWRRRTYFAAQRRGIGSLAIGWHIHGGYRFASHKDVIAQRWRCRSQEGERYQARAATENFIAYGCERAWKGYALQRLAVAESIATDCGYALGDDQVGDKLTVKV